MDTKLFFRSLRRIRRSSTTRCLSPIRPTGNRYSARRAVSGWLFRKTSPGFRSEVVFSLAETDPAFIDNEMLVADTANGKPLFGAQGRFRLVVPKDKPGARSVRMLTTLEVVQLRK